MEKRKKAKQVQDNYFNHLMKKGHQAGMVAAEGTPVTPMVVTEHPDMLPAGKKPQTWVVDEGVCGFAWLEIHPATGAFPKWVKNNAHRFTGEWYKDKYYNNGLAGMDFTVRKGHPTGLRMGVQLFGQGMTRKAAYAAGFANVLREAGINAYANNRMD